MTILFVCTGNTCRSAMAEGIMKKLAAERGLDINVISRGIYASNGNPASEEAINALLKLYNIDISRHTSKLLNFSDVENSDVVYVMTENHRNLLITTLENEELSGKIKNFSRTDVSDPYMGNKKEYEKCAKELYKGILKILKEEV